MFSMIFLLQICYDILLMLLLLVVFSSSIATLRISMVIKVQEGLFWGGQW